MGSAAAARPPGVSDGPLLARLTRADGVLVLAGDLLFLDSLLPWQRRCADIGGEALACQGSNAWGANGAAFGALMALLALSLASLILVERTSARPPAWAGSARPILIAGTLVFGGLKLILVVGHFPAIGAWLGLLLLAAIVLGAVLWSREPSD